MRKQLVITVHGVNPDRKWQQRTQDVLSPFFRCEPLYYLEYDTLRGPMRAVINIPAAIVAALLVLSAALLSIRLGMHASAAAVALLGGVAFAGSLGLARSKRRRCAAALKQQIERKGPLERPHVIAHSLGTYLLGSALEKFPDLRLDRVVLVSSVLPSSYPWDVLLTKRPTCVREVRNEFGPSDRVVRLVGRIRWLARDLGTAGSRGFFGDETVIHNTDDPIAPCPKCAAAPARVHNVSLAAFGHSDAFLGHGHARLFWLPFLWGFSAEEFSRYLDACRETSLLYHQGRWDELNGAVAKLWRSQFTWTNGATLRSHVRRFVAARLEHGRLPSSTALVNEISRDAETLLHLMVDQAAQEAAKDGMADEAAAQALHPAIAISQVVEYFLQEYLLANSAMAGDDGPTGRAR
jgi:pimeloyl-ACP methyl ester carboxylesterase